MWWATVVAACAAPQPTAEPPSPAPPEPPPDSILLPPPVRLAPTSGRYLIETNLSTNQECTGQRETQELHAQLYVTATLFSADTRLAPPDTIRTRADSLLARADTVLARVDTILADRVVLPADTGVLVTNPGFRARWGIDSAHAQFAGSAPAEDIEAQYAALQGLEFTAHVRPGGEPIAFERQDSAPAMADQVLSLLRHFYPRLPPQGVRPGDVWTDTTSDRTRVSEIEIDIRSVTTYEAAGWTEREGRRTLEIVVRGVSELAGMVNQPERQLDIEGDGRRHGTYYLTELGDYLGGVVTDTTNMGVRVVAAGVVVPVSQVATTSTVRLP